ncbi:MAG: glutaredoxin family protein [Gammaproteobacteria bacterium]
MPSQLTVYVRRGCHLCTDMTLALERLRHELDFTFVTVDIDRDPDLAGRYGTRVPVLVGGGGHELCYYFLDEDRLRSHCQRVPDTP